MLHVLLPGNGGETEEEVLDAVGQHILHAAPADLARKSGAKKLCTLIEGADLIVGSISHKVRHLAPCPVMSVR